ncbi:MAG TPA: hypothetical protein VHW74_00305 [Mycobacteriales bacterium]|jgi:hypothetical protein|nr:hypothetical protein [Mycobacteriales bacterium]
MLLTQPMASHHGETPGIPTSTVHVLGPTQVRYCVGGYAPSEPVRLTEAGGAAATIHTNYVGSGCTVIPYDVVCGNAGDAAVATGIGADGNPATSTATLTASAGAPTCAPSAVAHASKGGGLSSGAIGLLVGVVVVVLAGVVALVLRRRRSAE